MDYDIEAIILTGGASRRMGQDKSRIRIDGFSLAERTAAEFDSVEVPVTVLGNAPHQGRAFVRDADAYAGPAVALSTFVPIARTVFIASCDMPLFSGKCVRPIAESIGAHEAAIPVLAAKEQYLCAAYKASVFDEWKYLVDSDGRRSMRELVRTLDCKFLDEPELLRLGIEPTRLSGVNTPMELESLLRTNAHVE